MYVLITVMAWFGEKIINPFNMETSYEMESTQNNE